MKQHKAELSMDDQAAMSGSASDSDDGPLLPGEKESLQDDLPWDSVYLLKDDRITVGKWVFTFNHKGKVKAKWDPKERMGLWSHSVLNEGQVLI